MIDLSGKTALITGASRGVGRVVALEIAKAGAHVILLARTQGALEELDDEIRAANGHATLVKMDLRRLDNVDKLGPSILEQFGGLDILIGNAGMLGPLTPAHQISSKDWERVMIVNFMANVHLVRTLDPLLRASEAGRVVFNTAGKYAVDGMAYWSAYMASKASLNVFAKTYALETKHTNMRVNLVYPGATDTALMREAFPGKHKIPMKQPEEIVPTFMELISPQCEKHGELIEV